MWRRTSIFFQISLLFTFAFISFLAIAIFYIKIQPSLESIKQYNILVNAIGKMKQFNANLQEIRSFLEEENFHEVSVTESWKNKFVTDSQIPKSGSFNINVIQDGNDIFITLRTTKDFIVYRDPITSGLSKYHMITLIGTIILVSIYITLMKKLMPLNHIKYEITHMTRNNIFTKITHGVKNQDEIGELVREFNRSITKLDALSKSRSLFLRSIMHELKTPITKGRITAEMIDNPLYKERLCSVFERLNSLINEFAKIEELSSRNYCPNKQKILLQDVLKRVFEMLLLDEEQITSLFILPQNQQSLYADFEMISLVIKNLVDNAIKYKTQGQIEICIAKKDLWIKNYGNPLPYTLKDHSKPFFKDSKSNTSGLGLGIYIIKSTLETQGLELDYFHQNNQNIFIIKGVVSQKNLKDENV